MLSTDQLYVIAGVMIGICSVYSVQIIAQNYKNIKATLKNNREYRKKVADVKEYKSKGNFHSWVTLPVRTAKGIQETNVCQETGYCPAVEGFIPVAQVKHMLEMKKQGEEYEEFKKEEKKRIQQYFSIEDCDIDQLVSEIHDIKRKFHLKLMDKSIASLKEKLGPNVRVITNLSELEEAIKDGKNS